MNTEQLLKQLAGIVKNLYIQSYDISETQAKKVCEELDVIMQQCKSEVSIDDVGKMAAEYAAFVDENGVGINATKFNAFIDVYNYIKGRRQP